MGWSGKVGVGIVRLRMPLLVLTVKGGSSLSAFVCEQAIRKGGDRKKRAVIPFPP